MNCDLRDFRAQIGYFYENGYLNNLANYHYSKNGQYPHPPCFHFLWNCFSVTFALRIKKELLTKTYYHGLIWYFFFCREARGECEISQLAQLSRPGWQPKHTHTHIMLMPGRGGSSGELSQFSVLFGDFPILAWSEQPVRRIARAGWIDSSLNV